MDEQAVVERAGAGTASPASDRGALSTLTVRELLGYLAACESASRDGAGHVSLDALSREQDRIVGELRRRPADGTITASELRLVASARNPATPTRPRT